MALNINDTKFLDIAKIICEEKQIYRRNEALSKDVLVKLIMYFDMKKLTKKAVTL